MISRRDFFGRFATALVAIPAVLQLRPSRKLGFAIQLLKADNGLQTVQLDAIKLDPSHNARQCMLGRDIMDDRLLEDIRQNGLINPIIVAEDHSLFAGYRRVRAMKKLGWTEAPCYVIDMKRYHEWRTKQKNAFFGQVYSTKNPCCEIQLL